MRQVTSAEWIKEQLRRAPSFATAAAIMMAALVISAFIELSSGLRELRPQSVAGLFQEEEERIRDLDFTSRKDERKLPEGDFEQKGLPEPKFDPEVSEPPVTDDLLIGPVVDAPPSFDTSDAPPTDLLRKPVIGTGPSPGRLPPGLIGRTQRGRDDIRETTGVPNEVDKAVWAALRWLKRTQNRETGGWDCAKFGGQNEDRGVTGLALLAFLSYGCTDKHPAEFALTVKKAIQYLVKSQQKEGEQRGSFGERMYTQGICTMALAEAYGLTRNRAARDAAQAGLDYILRTQPEHGAFDYQPGGTRQDVSVTGFQIQAIKAAMICRLKVPASARQRTEAFLARSLNPDSSTGYEVGQAGKASMTAAALTARLFMGHSPKASDCVAQANWLTTNGRHIAIGKTAQEYYTLYYMTLSMCNMGGKYWRGWRDAFYGPLMARQVKEGADKGSWPHDVEYGSYGGRVYTTAMACLALAVPFKIAPEGK